MDSTERDALTAECRSLARYLTGQAPSAYVIDKYCAAHAAGNILHSPDSDALETLLVRLARRHRLLTGLVDLYTSLFLKRALVRRKLVLLLAILESAAPTASYFDSTDSLSRLGFCAMLVRRGVMLSGMLLLSVVALGPLHLGLRGRSQRDLNAVREGRPAPRA